MKGNTINNTKEAVVTELWKQPLSPILFSLLVTGVFALLVVVGMMHHEMWRDELQAWMVARNAHSLPELMKNMKYEGNPALWHSLLFIITSFTHDPVYMQVLHGIIACGFVFVFNRYSEISRPYKVMFSFGYFTAYEYSIISRSYGLAVLLIMIVCALYKSRSARYLLISIVLALLANVTPYGIIIAVGFISVLAMDYNYYQHKDTQKRKTLIAGCATVLVGILFSVYQILPEPDNSFPVFYPDGVLQMDRWGSVLSKVFATYFYVPQTDGINFWNSSFYADTAPAIQQPFGEWFSAHTEYLLLWFVLPIITLIASAVIFLRKPLVLFLYTSVTLGLLCFYYYSNLVFCRYTGFLLIILIVCYWLEKQYEEKQYRLPALIFLSNFGKKIQTPFLITVLVVNMIGAAVAYAKDYQNDFSPSKHVAEYIQEHKLYVMTIGGAEFYIASPLAAYLDTPLYYFQMNGFGTYCIYDSRVRWNMPLPDIHKSILDMMHKGREKMLVVSSYEWKYTNDGGAHYVGVKNGIIGENVKFDFLKSFDAGIVNDEQYYLYLVHR